jgi:hypothetical protein
MRRKATSQRSSNFEISFVVSCASVEIN